MNEHSQSLYTTGLYFDGEIGISIYLHDSTLRQILDTNSTLVLPILRHEVSVKVTILRKKTTFAKTNQSGMDFCTQFLAVSVLSHVNRLRFL